MYKVDYMPIVTMHDITDAIEKRYGHCIEAQDLFGENFVNDVYCSYSLDRDRNIKDMETEEALTYLFVKSVITKDFNLFVPRILVDVSW